MGTIQIQFMGICVNFSKEVNSDLPVRHRIVLPRIDITNLPPIPELEGELLPPHFATLSYSVPSAVSEQPPSIVALPLTGCTVSVVNPLNFGDFTGDMGGIPNLTDLEASIGQSLGPPSTPVLYGKNASIVACWFDIDSGIVDGIPMPDGEIMTRVTIETDGDPLLRYVPFPGAIYPPVAQIEFTPPAGQIVWVQNVSMPGDEEDPRFHFYLNYLTAANLPAELKLPDSLALEGGPGCSNSNYP